MGWFSQLKLQTKLLIAFSVIILSAALSIGWFLYTLSRVTMQAEALVEDTNELVSVVEVQGLLRRQQQAVSDYVVTGESQYLADFQEAANITRQIIARTLINAHSNESR